MTRSHRNHPRTLPTRLIAAGTAAGLGWALVAVAPVQAAPTEGGYTVATVLRCRSGVPGDVNGDGYAEVAISEQGTTYHRGAVHVLYGQPGGLVTDRTGTALDDQLITAATRGVPGKPTPDNQFGQHTVFGDLNGDGCADLVISVAGANAGDGDGEVLVLNGSPQGLRTSGVQRFTPRGVFGRSPGRYTLFGSALAVGDLNGDRVADLAVGAPAWKGGSGAVAVLFGHRRGLNKGPERAAWVHQGTRGVPGTNEEEDQWGSSLAVADFDGRGAADLAVGAPFEDGEGSVQMLRYAKGRFTGSPRISATSPGVPRGEYGFGFGGTLAAGDLTGDGRAELAVSSHREGAVETEGGHFDGPGAVYVFRGAASGLTTAGSQRWTTASPGVDAETSSSAAFGASLAIGRLDADRFGDLAIGAPGDTIAGQEFAGSVTLLLGSSGGLTTAGAGGTRLSQGTGGVSDAPEGGDNFGLALTTAQLSSRTQANLIVSAPSESVGTVGDAGLVHQLAISPAGPTGIGSRSFTLGTPGLQGPLVAERNFGLALSGGSAVIDRM